MFLKVGVGWGWRLVSEEVCLCVWRQGFNLALDEVETSLPFGEDALASLFDEVKTSLPKELYEVESSFAWCVFDEVETSLPRV